MLQFIDALVLMQPLAPCRRSNASTPWILRACRVCRLHCLPCAPLCCCLPCLAPASLRSPILCRPVLCPEAPPRMPALTHLLAYRLLASRLCRVSAARSPPSRRLSACKQRSLREGAGADTGGLLRPCTMRARLGSPKGHHVAVQVEKVVVAVAPAPAPAQYLYWWW